MKGCGKDEQSHPGWVLVERRQRTERPSDPSEARQARLLTLVGTVLGVQDEPDTADRRHGDVFREPGAHHDESKHETDRDELTQEFPFGVQLDLLLPTWHIFVSRSR